MATKGKRAIWLNKAVRGDMKHFTGFKYTRKALAIALAFSSVAAMAAGTEPQPSTLSADTENYSKDGSAVASVDSPTVVAQGTNVSDSLPLQASTEPGQNTRGLSVNVPPPTGEMPGRRTGPLSGIGNALDAYGINLGLVLANLTLANPSTGTAPHNWANYFALVMSADVDLSKLIGLPNTQFHITEAWEPPSHNTYSYVLQTGSAFALAPVQTVSSDLVKFTLSHDLFDKRLHIEYGRMNINDDFMVPTMCNGCVASTPALTVNVPGFTKSLWGARIAYQLSHNIRLGLGAIEDNSDLFTKSSGWNWSSRTRTGIIGVANMLYTSDFSDSRYPLNAEVGVYHNTSPYTDDLYNVDGSSQALNPFGTALKHGSGTWGFYGQGRKVVWTAAGSEGPVRPNIALYGGAFITPGVGQSYPVEAFGGAEYGGFLKNSPMTLVGTTVRYIRLSHERALFEQQLSTVSGWGSDAVHQNTFSFELHAQYGIAPGILVNGFAQYFLHPDRARIFAALGPTRSGIQVGVGLIIDLGVLSGLARPK
jgi:porin